MTMEKKLVQNVAVTEKSSVIAQVEMAKEPPMMIVQLVADVEKLLALVAMVAAGFM